jgi:hypothetical protein
MGLYLNPKNGKEDFLQKYAIEISAQEFLEFPDGEIYGLVHVDNGPFTALAVAYSPSEARYFVSTTDYRPKRFYMVSKSDLIDHSDLRREDLRDYGIL